MYLETKEDTSVLYFLSDVFVAFPFVSVVDEFPETPLEVPTVALSVGKSTFDKFQMGSTDERRVRQYTVDVFANSKVQRNEFSYAIINALKSGIMVYNYDEGFPPEVSPSVRGHLDVVSKHFIPVEILQELVEKLYYRATVKFVVTNDRT